MSSSEPDTPFGTAFAIRGKPVPDRGTPTGLKISARTSNCPPGCVEAMGARASSCPPGCVETIGARMSNCPPGCGQGRGAQTSVVGKTGSAALGSSRPPPNPGRLVGPSVAGSPEGLRSRPVVVVVLPPLPSRPHGSLSIWKGSSPIAVANVAFNLATCPSSLWGNQYEKPLACPVIEIL